MSEVCGAVLEPGEPWEHRCGLPPHPVGTDHRCGDCGDTWSSLYDDDE